MKWLTFTLFCLIRIAAKAEEKKDATLIERQKEQVGFFLLLFSRKVEAQDFLEQKSAGRQERSEYQKQIGDQYIAKVEKQLERWQNARKARKANHDFICLGSLNCVTLINLTKSIVYVKTIILPSTIRL
ncbi:uncharacterized protein LOC104452575 [Eucalyptus grandis]|uniref:uncharacterized protein LOC104452575 n=1 Tax=Eucalyptus grandis TaxID=71139 RepID=UPI00192EB7BA|nr:uncharacterized protein LOC104452575 [Eucalyptus grandis]